MDWYYSKNNQQQGPVTRERLEELVRSGEVKPFDLVWNETMTDWVPLGSLPGFALPPVPQAQSPGPSAAPPLAAAPPSTIVHSYDPPPAAGASAGTNGLAIASLVMGILSPLCCGCFTALPAIICGHIALSQISKSPLQSGKGLAIAGLVLGYLGIVLSIAMFMLSGTEEYQRIIEEMMKEIEASQEQGAPAPQG